MKTWVLFTLMLFPQLSSATNIEDMIGTWRFYKYKFEGQVVPAPNPNLRLLMGFCEGGTQVLYWDRKGEPGFCERLAEFDVQGNQMFLKVFWINPENHMSCAKDPDMVMGKESVNRIEHIEGELHLYLELNGNDLIFIFKPEEKGNYLCQKPYP